MVLEVRMWLRLGRGNDWGHKGGFQGASGIWFLDLGGSYVYVLTL